MKQILGIEWIGAETDLQLKYFSSLEATLNPKIQKYKSNKPWCAEILSMSEKYGFERRFIKENLNYSKANASGTRGVELKFIVECNKPHEGYFHLSWKKKERKFFYMTEAGEFKEITKKELIAWLQKNTSDAPY